MSIINQIKNAQVVDASDMHYYVFIEVNGCKFYGWSNCHPDDRDFCSKTVGTTIAHYRAMIDAMKWERDRAKREWKTLKKAYDDAYQNKPIDPETPNAFRSAVWQYENRYHKYQKEVINLRAALRTYLKNQERVVTSLKLQREIKAKQASNN